MNLKIDYHEYDNRNVVRVDGEIDAYTAPKLREVLIPMTEKQGASTIIDLSHVSYMDSTGLGVFIGALKSVNAHNGTMKIIGLTQRVERLFNITGLAEVIDIDPTVRGGLS